MATRQPPKVPTFTKTQVAQAVKADDAKRRARAASKRAAKKAKSDAEAHDDERARAEALQKQYDADQAQREAENRTAEEAAWTEDAIALGRDPAEYILEQRVVDPEPTGKPRKEATYFGPMLALRSASKSYVKAANGILCNGDDLAQAVGALTREEVVTVLQTALKLESNPYAHLNPGQQSMNSRNKARQAIKAGTLTMAEVRALVTVALANRK